MPFAVDILSEFDLAWVRLHGRLTFDALVAALDTVRASPDRHAGTREWWDVTGSDASRLDFDALRRFAERRMEHVGDQPLMKAIIVGDPLQYGMARMYQELVDAAPVEVELFDSADAAALWLGFPDVPAPIRAGRVAGEPGPSAT